MATLDARGYFEGLFSNAFRCLRYNESKGLLEVTNTIELPHVSRYGAGTINSTNSGKLLPQADGILHGFGAYAGLWHDPLLNHEQVELGPCCWVGPWTKVVGQSPEPHETDGELVNDKLSTYMMPFSMAGVGGDLTRGLVMPGELSNGLGPKQRRGAWVFTYAPDAVINMVGRLYYALQPSRKHVADTIVVEALRTAAEMVKAMAAENNVDLSVPVDEQRKGGWPGWIAKTNALLQAHLEGELWRFEAGRPVEWQRDSQRWSHPRMDRLLAVAVDALSGQVSEEEIFGGDDAGPRLSVAVSTGQIDGTSGPAIIDPSAKVSASAVIGPGCRIGPQTVVADGAMVWNSVLDGCKVERGARVERSLLTDTEIAAGVSVRSCRMSGSSVGQDSVADAAVVRDSCIAQRATIGPFADLSNVTTKHGAILGGPVADAEIGSYLMSMHIAGSSRYLRVLPTPVELDGRRVLVAAVPMIGAGALIRGTAQEPVEMECCFVGSNTIIEAGTRLGFGCFVLGTVGPHVDLPPFTICTGGEPQRHQIGAVLSSLSSTIITHFINWTFQAVGPQHAAAVAEMTRQAIARGIDSLESEQARRADGNLATDRSTNDDASLSEYSEAQLAAGLQKYRAALQSGAWEIACRDEQLWFSSHKGCWQERDGSAFWKKNT